MIIYLVYLYCTVLYCTVCMYLLRELSEEWGMGDWLIDWLCDWFDSIPRDACNGCRGGDVIDDYYLLKSAMPNASQLFWVAEIAALTVDSCVMTVLYTIQYVPVYYLVVVSILFLWLWQRVMMILKIDWLIDFSRKKIPQQGGNFAECPCRSGRCVFRIPNCK